MTGCCACRILIAAALAWPVLTTAADLPLHLAPAVPSATAPGAGHGNGFAPPEVACMEWTDGCRTCQRPATGEAVCSNVGIACVPQAMRCTRR
jgi:hypothetical protein